MFTTRQFISCVFLSLAFSDTARAGKDEVHLPTTIESRVIFVQIQVNGKGPFTFILDTGATETIMTPPTAERLGLHPLGGSRAKKTMVTSIGLGNATVRNLTAFIFDPPQALPLRLDKGINYHGILGYTFLHRFVTTIDYRHERVTLIRTLKYRRPSSKNKQEADVYHLPFRLLRNLIHARGRINGEKRSVTFLVDTGSAETLLLPRTASLFDIPTSPLPNYEHVGFARLKKLDMAGAVVSSVPTIIHALPHEQSPKTSYDGILGYPFLSNFVVTINYRDKQLTLQPYPNP